MTFAVNNLHPGRKYANYIGGFPTWVQKLEHGPQAKKLTIGVVGALALSAVLSGILFSTNTLPATVTPENEAKHLAWMKFNNVNPIFGVSSKK